MRSGILMMKVFKNWRFNMYKHGEHVVNSQNNKACTIMGSQSEKIKTKNGMITEEVEYFVRYEDGSTDWIPSENAKKLLID